MGDDHEILVSAREYRELLRSERKLIALLNAGVDNWEFYDEAMEEFYNEDD